jgi:cytoskeleton protein RodZ
MTVGAYLKKTREEKNLTLEQAAKITRVRLHYLEALENDQWDMIPSITQGRGFLRLYSGFLGIQSQFILDMFDGKTIQEPVVFHSALANSSVAEEIDPEQKQPVTPAIFDKIKKRFSHKEPGSVLPEPDQKAPLPVSPGSKRIYGEIGDTLRKQRESLGLSLNDIENYTHVRLHYLQAIEDGSMDRLPSPVQSRGMLQNYARFLDLDADKILLRFADALQSQHAEKELVKSPGKTPTKKPPPRIIQRLLTPDLLIGGFLIIALVGFAIWTTRQVINARNQQAAENIPNVSEILLATPSVDLLPASPDATVESTPTPLQNSDIGGATPITIATETLPAVSNAPLQVYVVSRLRTYMKVSVDGKVEFEGRVIPGNAYPFNGNSLIELVAGNAAAIQVFFNQNDMGTIGILGQSISLNFTPAGVITPTPRFTLTASATMPPTETPIPTSTPQTPTITPYVP